MSARCALPGCFEPTARYGGSRGPLCRPHWLALPEDLQVRVREAGQEGPAEFEAMIETVRAFFDE